MIKLLKKLFVKKSEIDTANLKRCVDFDRIASDKQKLRDAIKWCGLNEGSVR